MKTVAAVLFVLLSVVTQAYPEDGKWYTGDGLCPAPRDDGTYSAPYNAQDHPHDYPTFEGADKPGWSCSYQMENGVIVQYGDGRTPQQQWLDIYGGNSNTNEN